MPSQTGTLMNHNQQQLFAKTPKLSASFVHFTFRLFMFPLYFSFKVWKRVNLKVISFVEYFIYQKLGILFSFAGERFSVPNYH